MCFYVTESGEIGYFNDGKWHAIVASMDMLVERAAFISQRRDLGYELVGRYPVEKFNWEYAETVLGMKYNPEISYSSMKFWRGDSAYAINSQGCITVFILFVHIRSMLHQQLNRFYVVLHGCFNKRCFSTAILRIYISPCAQQAFCNCNFIQFAFSYDENEWCSAVYIA